METGADATEISIKVLKNLKMELSSYATPGRKPEGLQSPHARDTYTVFTAAGSLYKSRVTETRRMGVENAHIHEGILFSYKD